MISATKRSLGHLSSSPRWPPQPTGASATPLITCCPCIGCWEPQHTQRTLLGPWECSESPPRRPQRISKSLGKLSPNQQDLGMPVRAWVSPSSIYRTLGGLMRVPERPPPTWSNLAGLVTFPPSDTVEFLLGHIPWTGEFRDLEQSETTVTIQAKGWVTSILLC